MSKQAHVIEVTPPVYEDKVEQMIFCNYKCPVCYGRGFLSQNDDEVKYCHYCEGSGRVRARVTINWEADL